MNETDKLLNMRWDNKKPICLINKNDANNIMRIIKKKSMNCIWFGYTGTLWIEALNKKSIVPISIINRNIKIHKNIILANRLAYVISEKLKK